MNKYKMDAKSYGYVGNAKALCELGPALMTTAGIEEQLEVANKILASAKYIKKACEKALKEEKC
jgi:hypothetical protein